MGNRNDLAFYDQQAARWWDETAPIYPLNFLNPLRFQYFDRHVPRWQGLHVLDVGCGGGYTCEFLARRGAQVTGVDQSWACIQAAQAHAQQQGWTIAYRAGAAEQLPYADDRFDVVVCVDVLEHVRDVGQTLREVRRVLKPNGLFCFDTVNRTLRSRLVMIWLLENLLREIPRGLHDWRQFIQPQELRSLSHRAGFEQIEFAGLDLFGSHPLAMMAAYRHYRRTGRFKLQSETDLSVMYIGVAR